ncbi:hypothetical protein K1719_005034 [Acacia pycnantha]|nr:hypothetical protein K1719_005034 [Acacia pycnantha]
MKIFADNKLDLLKDFDLLGNTAINMEARSNNPEILKELLGNLSEEQKWRAFRKKNSQGNTLLHDMAVNCSTVVMADIVLDFERTTPLPPELAAEKEDIAELSEEEKRRPLLEWKNLKGETPVFKAAKFGNLKMLNHLVKRVDGGDIKIHQENSGETILHASVNSLSSVLPKEGYNVEGCNSFDLLRSPERDIETGAQDDARPPTPVFNWIESIWEGKKKHQLAKRLAVFLGSQKETRIGMEGKEKKKLYIWKTLNKKMKKYKHHSALLIAASNGIQKIIKLYIKEHPESINHVSEDGQNLLQIAVRHRQEKILDWLEKQAELNSLASQVDRENHKALHQAAGLDYYRGSTLAGAAFQLQEELEWYKRVEKIVPTHLHLHCDNERLKAGDLLDIEHNHMLANAQKWIKETA